MQFYGNKSKRRGVSGSFDETGHSYQLAKESSPWSAFLPTSQRTVPVVSRKECEIEMRLERATDLATVREAYIDIIDNTPEMELHARWKYGLHPDDGLIQEYINNGEMYFLMDDDQIVGAEAVTMYQDEDYHQISWQKELEDDEVASIHILAVCPEQHGRGIGRELVKEAIRLAGENGKKAVRLDTFVTNTPAQHLYEGLGFKLCGTQNLYTCNVGWTDFMYYEYLL